MNEEEERAFLEIANDLASMEANEWLDSRMEALDRWFTRRESVGEPTDLRSLIMQMLMEPNERMHCIVALATAMWRLREMESRHGNQ